MRFSPLLARVPLRSHTRQATRSALRYLSIPASSPPQAYLRPLTSLLPPTTPGLDELGGAFALCLDRPQAKNALSVQMVGEIRESLSTLSATSSSRLLIVHSLVPQAFCAGADLRERRTMSPTQVDDFLRNLRAMLDELEGVKVPSVAVLDGWAMGGGLELALATDLRVGGRDMKAALPETKLGIIPGAGGTQRLTRLVGVAKAKELIFTGRRVECEEAERIGLINIFAREPRNSALDEAVLLSRQILTSAPLALAAAKQAISAAPTLPLGKGLDLERALYDPLLSTSDRLEGLAAFAEKRRAVFQGK